MPVYFDVGANDGDSMIHHAFDSNNTVYGFEPTPRLAYIIKEKTRHLPNYVLVEKAVSDFDGKATFYVAGQENWGCSSLCKFNDGLEETWPGRTDFKVTDTVEVDVIRLDAFIEEHGIEEIEFFHCDAQGKDLEVLIGMGDHVKKIKKGCIEMPSRHHSRLYKDQKYTVLDAEQFLISHGFSIDSVDPNDYQGNEMNIRFSRHE